MAREHKDRRYKGVIIAHDLDYIAGHWYQWKVKIEVTPVADVPVKRKEVHFKSFATLNQAKAFIDYFF